MQTEIDGSGTSSVEHLTVDFLDSMTLLTLEEWCWLQLRPDVEYMSLVQAAVDVEAAVVVGVQNQKSQNSDELEFQDVLSKMSLGVVEFVVGEIVNISTLTAFSLHIQTSSAFEGTTSQPVVSLKLTQSIG